MDALELPDFTLAVEDGLVKSTLRGRMDRDQMRAALDWFETFAETRDSFDYLARVERFRWPSFGAMAEEASRLGDVFAWTRKMRRCAVLSDTAWIRAGAWIEGALIPGLSIKTYGLDGTSAALAWLTVPDRP